MNGKQSRRPRLALPCRYGFSRTKELVEKNKKVKQGGRIIHKMGNNPVGPVLKQNEKRIL